MSKLPNIYKCEINKEIRNNKEYCYLENREYNDVGTEINNLFNSLGPVHTKKVLIKTHLREFETYIYKRNNDYLLTKELDVIKIRDIVSIKRLS